MHEGHIRLFRKMKYSPCYKDSQYVHLWVHLLMAANWSDKRVKLKGSDKFIDLKAGQFLTSRDSLSEQTGIQSSKIERILNTFKSEQQIEQQSFAKYRVISITNWHLYQNGEQQNEQQMNSKRTADEQQMNTDNNNKNKKKEPFDADGAIFEECWNEYVKKVGKEDAHKHFKAQIKNVADAKSLYSAVQNYSQMVIKENRERRHIKDGSGFFNKSFWSDYAE